MIAPLVLLLAGAAASSAALQFLLSLDVPLTLALAGAVTLDALGVESRASDDDWISPRTFQPALTRWMSRQRWLYVMRWPAGLAIASGLLAYGASSGPESLNEMLLMAVLGLLLGASFAWALRRPAESRSKPVGSYFLKGVAALSWVALRDARDRFDLRRAMVLAVPALLAAPLGATASQVASMLVLWLPLLFVLIVCHEAARVHGALRRWLGSTFRREQWLTYWIWRHVAVGIAAIATLGLLWWSFGMSAPARQE